MNNKFWVLLCVLFGAFFAFLTKADTPPARAINSQTYNGAGTTAITATGSSLNTNVTNTVPVTQSGAFTDTQGPPNSVSSAWPVKITDGTNVMGVSPASTAPTAAQPAGIVGLSPNGNHATSALQTTGNASLSSIDAGVPAALGQTTKANSMPVVIPSDQTLSTKTALNANSPFQVSAGVTSGVFLASNTSRTGMCAVNVSGATACFGLGVAAVLNSGICLYPGGSWCMDEFSFTTGAINIIAGAATSVVSGQEYQ